MTKSRNFKLNRLIFVITLILTITITVGRGTILYQKTWSTEKGSELKIEVTPNNASFQPEEIYSYTFVLTAVKFGSNIDRFHQINLSARFLNAKQEISNNKGNYELSSVGSQVQVTLELVIPSASSLSLDSGETLSGNLQYKIGFKEGYILIDPLFSMEWETITEGNINVPSDKSTPFNFGGLALLLIPVGGLVIYFLLNQRKKQDFLP